MFSFFKRKTKPKAQENSDLVVITSESTDTFAAIIEAMAPNERVMSFVGYMVARPTIFAAMGFAAKQGENFTVDEFIQASDEAYNQAIARGDEINSRRLWWCAIGASIVKIDLSAKSNVEVGGRIWASLLRSVEFANGALARNVIWKADEKESLIGEPLTRMQTVLSVYMPKTYSRSSAIVALCSEKNLYCAEA